MPQSKPSRYHPLGRFRLPTPKPLLQLSLFQEYPYTFFVAFFVVVALLGKSLGLSLWDALVVGAWMASLMFFGWQLMRYLKYRANPQAVAKEEAARRAVLEAKTRQAKGDEKTAPSPLRAQKPKIAVVPRKPAQRVPIRKPGMNVKPQHPQQQPQADETPKT